MAGSYRKHRNANRDRPYRHKPGRLLFRIVGPFVIISAFAVSFGWSGGTLPALPSAPLPGDASDDSCNIKGNISIDTGERIYHAPGQKYYQQTRISPQHGERWFCSEAEAREAGWRKSRV